MSSIDTQIYDNRLGDVYNQPTRIDEVTSTLTYIGWVKDYTHPVDETQPQWRIKKIEQMGTVWFMEYADGNGAYDNVWADRALLQYS